MADGSVVIWGDGFSGVTGWPIWTPVQQAGLTDIVYVSTASGNSRQAAVSASGAAYMWGAGQDGAVGHGATSNAGDPVRVVRDLAWLGAELFPGSRLTPSSSSVSGGWLSEVFVLPGVLFGGDVRVVRFEGWSRMGDAEQVVVNQAFVDSPLTPITGVPAMREASGLLVPLLPSIPAPGVVDVRGVPGNPTCDTDATTPQHIHPGWNRNREDSCDQVPALVPALPPGVVLGHLGGVAWVDLNRDGLRDAGEPVLPGVLVTVTRNGVYVGSTTTGPDGVWELRDLYPGPGFEVHFSISHLTPTNAEDTFAFTTQYPGAPGVRRGSDAAPDTGLAHAAEVFPGLTTFRDAGVVAYGPAISVVKYSPIGEDQTIALIGATSYGPIEVRFRFTNVGSEPLHQFRGEDVTLSGPEVAWTHCAAPTPAPADLAAAAEALAEFGEATDETVGSGAVDVMAAAAGLALAAGSEVVADLTGLLAGVVVLAPGYYVTCYGTLMMDLDHQDTLDGVLVHHDVVNIRGTGVSTNRNVGGQDDWQVTITEEIFDFEMPPLPDTGGPGTNWVTWVALVVLAAAGAFALLVVVNKRKAVPAPART